MFYKKILLKILQISQDNTCVGAFFNKVAVKSLFLLKKRLWRRYFSVNFAKYLRKHFYRKPLHNCICLLNLFWESSILNSWIIFGIFWMKQGNVHELSQPMFRYYCITIDYTILVTIDLQNNTTNNTIQNL